MENGYVVYTNFLGRRYYLNEFSGNNLVLSTGGIKDAYFFTNKEEAEKKATTVEQSYGNSVVMEWKK